MNHTALTPTPLPLRRHGNKAFHLAHEIPLGRIPPVFAPFAGEGTSTGGVFRQGRNLRFAHEWEEGGLIEKGAAAPTRGEGLVEKGGINDADDRVAIKTEGYGDAEHGEEVGEVHSAIEGVDDPGRGVCDEVIAGSTS